MIYTVLIGDIQSSKKIPSISRQKIQTSIEKKFNKIDNKYTKEILSPLKITLGDEFQAVFKSPESAWGLFLDLVCPTLTLNLSLKITLWICGQSACKKTQAER
jgi:hypothetical protein